jgi:uncharacterized protein (DUF362 family)
MNAPLPHRPPGVTRRGFLLGTGAGLAAGASLTWLGLKGLERLDRENPAIRSFTGHSVPDPHALYAMPGPYPGRVIEIHHPGAVRANRAINAQAVKRMMDRGMCELTGTGAAEEAWRHFFEPGDVVGIKVNPVGHRSRRGVTGAISSPAVLLETVAGLKSAGVKAGDIVVFERYATEFRQAGYERVMRERAMDGVRWYASSLDGGELQVDIEGYDGRRDRDPHVVGYDPDAFVHMGFASPYHDPKDDRRFRSHLSLIVSRMVNKFITIPVLKDHRSAGVTLALKNLSHGLSNNVARSHLSNIARRDGTISGPNQCNTFIPTAASQLAIRQKATLHILDGLIGVYEGGPGSWNKTWATWSHESLLFATDPVAMDHVGWDIIDAKRAQEGWQPVAKMGLLQDTPAVKLSARLAMLAARQPADAAALGSAGEHLEGGRETEAFDRRQPEHIILAGMAGLGLFDARLIEHRRIELPV